MTICWMNTIFFFKGSFINSKEIIKTIHIDYSVIILFTGYIIFTKSIKAKG